MNADFVFIKGMDLACRIGTTEQERAFPQILHVNIRIYLPLMKAGTTDSLADTVDYAEIITQIRSRTQQRAYTLAEAVAENIATIVLTSPLARAVEVEVNKKVFEGIGAVGAFVRREKNTA